MIIRLNLINCSHTNVYYESYISEKDAAKLFPKFVEMIKEAEERDKKERRTKSTG